MDLTKGIMLDGRYKLLQVLGNGATAQVWLAHDSLANIRVAVKVFDAIEGDGIRDFQQEFSRVYNINHQNLLTPTNYSVSGDVPYLVMPYCENGSAKSMVGRCNQSDIVPFIRDVAAALATLHANNIVHQDIKPENIMIDDNISFKVTDFGISMARDDENCSYGGTYPYMAAERFNGVLEPSGDIWAFGATIFEMIEGNPPFGPDGGISQAQGNSIPPVTKTKIDSYLYDLICKMLDPDPALRPTADKIHADMEFFLRYKRWPDHNPVLQYSVAAVILAVFTLGLWIWSETRTKVYYCKDYVEVNREPQMIDILTGSEHAQRFYSYRVEVKRGHVRRVTLVNAKGYPQPYKDYRQLPLRYPDQEYKYNNEFLFFGGTVDQVVCRDEDGCQVVTYEYEETKAGETIVFKDEKGDRMTYSSTYYSQTGLEELYGGTSRIMRMKIVLDSLGRVEQRIYMDDDSKPLADANGAYSHRLSYTDAGQVASVTHIGSNGSALVGDATGCAERRFEFDESTLNLKSVSMFGVDGSPVCDYQGRAVVSVQCDEHGNVVSETHTDANGRHVPRRSDGAYGFRVSYKDGYCTEYAVLDANGNAMETNNGFALVRFECDPVTGNDKYIRYYKQDRTTYVYGYMFEYDELGRVICLTSITEDGKPTDGPDGFCSRHNKYDDMGHLQEIAFFDVNNKPMELRGTHRETYHYDDRGRNDCIRSYNKDGLPAPNMDGVCITVLRYNDSKLPVPTEVSYYAADSTTLVLSRNGYASKINTFDSNGRLTNVAFHGTGGKDIKLFGSFASIRIFYEGTGSRVSKVVGYEGSATNSNPVCEVSASLMPDGRPLLTAAISSVPVAFYQERTGTSRSVVAKDNQGNFIDVTMPNGAVGYRLTRTADGEVSCENTGQAVKSGRNVSASIYYLIYTYFYDYIMLYPNYVIEQETPDTSESTATTTGQQAATAWQQTLRQQNASMPKAVYQEDGIVWLIEKYEWTANTVIVTLRAKHITGTNYDPDDVNSMVNQYRSYPHRQLGVPNTVAVKVRVLNNQRQTIVQR